MARIDKYVITGGPGVGKTTLCNELGARGYEIVPEAARAIIAEEQAREQRGAQGILPWTDLDGFQRLVYRRCREQEQAIKGREAFLDRGLLDGVAYCWEGGIPLPRCLYREMEEHIWRPQYKAVFLLEQLPAYAADGERKEDVYRARKLHELLGRAYEEAGYKLTHVPVLPPAQRAQFIIDHIQSGRGYAGRAYVGGTQHESRVQGDIQHPGAGSLEDVLQGA